MSSIDLSVHFVRLFAILAAIRAAYAAIETAENVRDANRRGLKVMVDKGEVYAAAKAAYDTIPALRAEVAEGIEYLKANCSWLDNSLESCRMAKEDITKAVARSRLGKLWAGACSSAYDIKYREAGEIIKTLS